MGPKRFTDTHKWKDDWFQDLSNIEKLFWLYILDECDGAGIWKVNLKLASFHIGKTLEATELLTAFKGRIENLGTGYWWIPKFCPYQYKTLTDKCPPHRKYIESLYRHGVYEKVMGLYQGDDKAKLPLKLPTRLSLPLPKAKLRSLEEE